MALRPLLLRLQRVRIQSPTNLRVPSQVLGKKSPPYSPQITQESLSRNFYLLSVTFAKKAKSKPFIFTISEQDEVQVFDHEDRDLGLMTQVQAENLAKAENLHLVVVPDRTQLHPVFKLMTGKELVEEEKREKMEKRSHPKHKQRSLIVSSKIMEHDLNIKIQKAVKWLQKEDHVQVMVKIAQPGKDKQAVHILQQFADACKGLSTVKQSFKNEKELLFVLNPIQQMKDKTVQDPIPHSELKGKQQSEQ